MNEDVRTSRQRISRRRALQLGGTVGLGGLLAACAAGGDSGSTAGGTTAGGTTAGGTTAGTTTAAAGGAGTGTSSAGVSSATTATASDAIALLESAKTCTLAKEETQGPYWFEVDSIRSDIREDRPGTPLHLALRVTDVSNCSTDGKPIPIANSVVEIWHCDAGGAYSGFESGSAGGGPGGPGRNSGNVSDGSYSKGDVEASTSDDGTYLRGAQVADASGLVRFTTIYPGWYRGRTVHIHLKVHVDKKTVLTTQLFFDEGVNDSVFATSPYDDHGGRDTTNATDTIFDEAGLLTLARSSDGYLGAINLGVDA